MSVQSLTKRVSTPIGRGGHSDAVVPTPMESLLAAYLDERAASPRYVESLRRTVKKMGLYGILHVCQLTPQRVNDFLRNVPVGPTTKANYRRELLTLWRFAWERGYTEVQPRGVMPIRPGRQAPQAWGLPELSKLLTAAEEDKRIVNRRYPGVQRKDLLPCWIALGYDSGLRLTDVLALRGSDVRNGCVVVTANKTGKVTTRPLSQYAVEQCNHVVQLSPDGTLFRWILPRRRALMMWRDFLDGLGMHGSSKWLRRSGATMLESNHPGMATRWLDHSAPHLARNHYLDPTLLPPPVGPPALR